jgi:hypothetical protein
VKLKLHHLDSKHIRNKIVKEKKYYREFKDAINCLFIRKTLNIFKSGAVLNHWIKLSAFSFNHKRRIRNAKAMKN